jgi:hypothetical protein
VQLNYSRNWTSDPKQYPHETWLTDKRCTQDQIKSSKNYSLERLRRPSDKTVQRLVTGQLVWRWWCQNRLKSNTMQHDHKPNSIAEHDQVTQWIMATKPTRVNDTQTADAEVFTTGRSQFNIVWKWNTLQLSVHVHYWDPIREWGMPLIALPHFP